MRKTTVILLAAILLLTMTMPALAATNTYDLPELKLSLEIPEEYLVFTREPEDIDAELEYYGMTKEELLDIMLSSDIYLDAFSADWTSEIVVTMTENTIKEMGKLSDDILMGMKSMMEEEYESMNVEMSSFEIYHTEVLTFIRIYFHNPEASSYSLQYYTIYDHRAMNFTLHSFDGQITRPQEQLMEKLVNSIRLDGVQTESAPDPAPSKPAETQSQSEKKPVQKEDDDGSPIIAVLAGAVLGAAVVIILLRRKSVAGKKKQPPVRQAPPAPQPARQLAIVCHVCGSPTIADSLFCYKCGTRLWEGAARVPMDPNNMPVPYSGDGARQGKKLFCDHCGERLLMQSNFCRRCGKKVSQ